MWHMKSNSKIAYGIFQKQCKTKIPRLNASHGPGWGGGVFEVSPSPSKVFIRTYVSGNSSVKLPDQSQLGLIFFSAVKFIDYYHLKCYGVFLN